MSDEAQSFSPPSLAVLAGIALRPMPPVVLNALLAQAMRTMMRRHPGMLERLSSLSGATVVIEPDDLPFRFALALTAGGMSLRLADEAEAGAATVRGPLVTLIDLLEGRLDGDALFFSRDLVIEGDMEAVVALRNAAEAEEIRLLDDLLSVLGILAGPVRAVLEGAGGVLSRAGRDLGRLAALFARPIERRLEAQRQEVRRLEDRVATLEDTLKRVRPRSRRSKVRDESKP